MLVYLIRHAETDKSRLKIYQTVETPLSSNGVFQAKRLKMKFNGYDFGKIISGSHQRCLETADILSKGLQVPVTINPLFNGIRHPSQVTGMKKNDPKVIDIMSKVERNFLQKRRRLFDEEAFDDPVCRAKLSLDTLESQTAENVLVVSHGNYIKLLLCMMMFGAEIEPSQLQSFWKFYKSYYTSIATVEYHKDSGWRLLSYNDYFFNEYLEVGSILKMDSQI